MRMIEPEWVHEAVELQIPRMRYNAETKLFELRPDAPPEVVEARRKFLEYDKSITGEER